MTTATPPPAPTRTSAHKRSIGGGIGDIVRALTSVLGTRAVADIVGKDSRTVQRWASKSSGSVDVTAERVLRDTFQVYLLIASLEDSHTVRAWFLGLNPVLDDQAPIDLLIAGRARAVVAAARAYVNAS